MKLPAIYLCGAHAVACVSNDVSIEAEAGGDVERVGAAGDAPHQPVRRRQRGLIELHARVLKAAVLVLERRQRAAARETH